MRKSHLHYIVRSFEIVCLGFSCLEHNYYGYISECRHNHFLISNLQNSSATFANIHNQFHDMKYGVSLTELSVPE